MVIWRPGLSNWAAFCLLFVGTSSLVTLPGVAVQSIFDFITLPDLKRIMVRRGLGQQIRRAEPEGSHQGHAHFFHDPTGSPIIFVCRGNDTLHAQTLAGEFQKMGVDADYVDYSRKDAQDIILKYQEKKKPDVWIAA